MLQAMEHTPTLSSSVVFTFGLTIESIKELGGASFNGRESNWQFDSQPFFLP
jgi:hypothetical protein